MLKKKRNLLFASCLVGLLATTSAATVALSSCSTSTTNSSSSNSSNDVQYSYVIDWNNEDAVKRLIIDNNGFVYSDNTMSTIIAVSPKVKLTTVKIPSSVKSIMGYSRVMYKSSNGTLYDQIPSSGTASSYTKVYQSYGAFQGMESLETVTLEAGTQLQSIGGAAFSNCINLQNITNLSSSLEYIGISAFNNCTNLQAIDISNVVKVDNYAFSGCTNLKNISGSSDNLKYIGAYAFNGCTNLEQVDISSTISVGDYAFYGCTILKDVSGASKNLLYIGVGSFYNCASLQEIDISNVANINNSAFYGCTGLSSIDLSNALVIGEHAFYNCSSLTSLGSLEKVTTMGQYAFYGATKSGANISIKLGKLSTLPNYAFYGALGLSTVDFSDNTLITAINNSSFTNSSIKEINLDGCSGLTTIGADAFNGCTNLTNVYLPSNDVSNLTTIGSGAFLNCSSLSIVGVKGTAAKSFVATEKLSTIGANFLAKTPITSVDLSSFAISSSNASRTPFGSATSLAYIPNLTTVTLPSNITTLNAGLFYGSGLSSSTGFSLILPSTITSVVYSSSSSITNEDNTTTQTVKNLTPFTNSGVASVDMSSITSYQTGSTTSLPKYLFNDAAKLTSVVLKENTTKIEDYAFAGTTALTSITYPTTSNTATVADTTIGFTPKSTLTTIGDKAFYNAFSKTANITLDLSNMSVTTTPTAFDNSNVVNLVLPKNTQIIAANSFNNMSRLTKVDFGSLTNLTSIVAPNFNNTKLTSIDLSNVTANFSTLFSEITSTNKLFTNLPTNCVVSLPATIGKFNESVFLDTKGDPITFSYPNGILFNDTTTSVNNGIGKVDNGVFSFVDSSDPRVTNIEEINMSNNNTVRSIGPNTFFGNSKLNSITLKASGISGGVSTDNQLGLFSTTTNITENSTNTTSPAQYIKTIVPFGNNTALTSLNYIDFTPFTSDVTGSSDVEKLFNTTGQTTWAEVAKIINSLSYQSTSGANAAAIVQSNMSNWTPYVGANHPVNSDIATNFVRGDTAGKTPSKVTLTNLYHYAGEETGNAIEFSATETKITFIHNGATWIYTNDGSTIKLTGTVNMYKLTNNSGNPVKSYLTYFNQLQNISSGNTHYIPGASINVTLTVATAAKTK